MHDFQPARFRNLAEKGLFVYVFAWFDKSWYNALLQCLLFFFIIPTDAANSSLSKRVQTNNSVFQAKFKRLLYLNAPISLPGYYDDKPVL